MEASSRSRQLSRGGAHDAFGYCYYEGEVMLPSLDVKRSDFYQSPDSELFAGPESHLSGCPANGNS
jgi:hypothetical protein